MFIRLCVIQYISKFVVKNHFLYIGLFAERDFVHVYIIITTQIIYIELNCHLITLVIFSNWSAWKNAIKTNISAGTNCYISGSWIIRVPFMKWHVALYIFSILCKIMLQSSLCEYHELWKRCIHFFIVTIRCKQLYSVLKSIFFQNNSLWGLVWI